MRYYVRVIGISLTQKVPQTTLKNFVTPTINVFVALQYPRFTVADRCWGLSLSSTLVSRMMLRLRSDCVTEQATVVTLSDLTVELSSVSPTVSVHLGGYGNEEDLELKGDFDRD